MLIICILVIFNYRSQYRIVVCILQLHRHQRLLLELRFGGLNHLFVLQIGSS